MVLRVVPIENGVDVGCGDVFKLLAEKFHGDIPKNLSAGGARDGDRIAAKAQLREVYGVLAEDVVAHPHVGEAPPCERVRMWLVELVCIWPPAFAFARPR